MSRVGHLGAQALREKRLAMAKREREREEGVELRRKEEASKREADLKVAREEEELRAREAALARRRAEL